MWKLIGRKSNHTNGAVNINLPRPMSRKVEQKILNSPLRPPSAFAFWTAHHSRDVFGGLLVFLVGVAVDQTLAHFREHKPLTVRWTNGEMQTNYARPTSVPSRMPLKFEIGVAEDGRLVWRAREN